MGTLQEVLTRMGFKNPTEFMELTNKLIEAKGLQAFVEWKNNNPTKESLLELIK